MNPIVETLLLVAGVIAILILAVFAARAYNRNKRKKNQAAARAPRPEPTHDVFVSTPASNDPTKIILGNFVRIGTDSHAVRGKIELDEDGFTWKEFWLESTGSKLWISVETEDGKTEVIQWTEQPIGDLKPGDKTIEYNGTKYKLMEKGEATYRTSGSVDLPATGRMKYYDYESADGAFLLSFERFDRGEWEMAEGFGLPEGMYEVEAGITRPGG